MKIFAHIEKNFICISPIFLSRKFLWVYFRDMSGKPRKRKIWGTRKVKTDPAAY